MDHDPFSMWADLFPRDPNAENHRGQRCHSPAQDIAKAVDAEIIGHYLGIPIVANPTLDGTVALVRRVDHLRHARHDAEGAD